MFEGHSQCHHESWESTFSLHRQHENFLAIWLTIIIFHGPALQHPYRCHTIRQVDNTGCTKFFSSSRKIKQCHALTPTLAPAYFVFLSECFAAFAVQTNIICCRYTFDFLLIGSSRFSEFQFNLKKIGGGKSYAYLCERNIYKNKHVLH